MPQRQDSKWLARKTKKDITVNISISAGIFSLRIVTIGIYGQHYHWKVLHADISKSQVYRIIVPR